MADGMGTQTNKGDGAKVAQSRFIKGFPFYNGHRINAGPAGRLVQGGYKCILVVHIELIADKAEGRSFFKIGPGPETLFTAFQIQGQMVGFSQQFFQCDPPHCTRTVGETRRDENREGDIVPGKDRQGMIDIVTIPVIQREGHVAVFVVWIIHQPRQVINMRGNPSLLLQ